MVCEQVTGIIEDLEGIQPKAVVQAQLTSGIEIT